MLACGINSYDTLFAMMAGTRGDPGPGRVLDGLLEKAGRALLASWPMTTVAGLAMQGVPLPEPDLRLHQPPHGLFLWDVTGITAGGKGFHAATVVAADLPGAEAVARVLAARKSPGHFWRKFRGKEAASFSTVRVDILARSLAGTGITLENLLVGLMARAGRRGGVGATVALAELDRVEAFSSTLLSGACYVTVDAAVT